MRRIRKFIRDVELHGHHARCEYNQLTSDGYSWYACTCAILDDDDFHAAVDHAIEERKENPPNLRDMHGSAFVDGWLNKENEDE